MQVLGTEVASLLTPLSTTPPAARTFPSSFSQEAAALERAGVGGLRMSLRYASWHFWNPLSTPDCILRLSPSISLEHLSIAANDGDAITASAAAPTTTPNAPV